MARSPLMYEDNQLLFGGKVSQHSVLTQQDYKLNELDLDPQESSFDLQQFIFSHTFEGVPSPPVTVSNTQSLIPQPRAVNSVYTEADSYQDTLPMPSVQQYIQPEESVIPRNYDLTTESSVDIQALLNYTGATAVKNETPAELPTCSLQSFQAELEPVDQCHSPGEGRSETADSPGPVRSSRKGKSKKRFPEKGSNEYIEKRSRNNVAVRKSRKKAKLRQVETEGRVDVLTRENDRLQKKVDLLSKELNVLKSLFLNVGAALPSDFESVLQK